MNMLLAKHASNFNALKRSTEAGGKATSASSKPTTTAAKKPKSTFSALKTSSAASTFPANPADASSKTAHAADDDEDKFFTSEGAGLGFVPAGKEVANVARAAATLELRGKLLGKRAREQKEDAAARRKKMQRGRMADDESDEDEGRSGVGKGRKKARNAHVAAEED